MRTNCVKYFSITEDGHKEEGFMTYRINDSGQVEKIEYHDHFIEYRFLPDGNMYEEVTIYDNGDIFKISYDYDDEGGLIGTEETNKYGEIVAKSYYNWTKPNRVVSIETVSYQDNLRWFETQYYRKDGQLSFTSMMIMGILLKRWSLTVLIQERVLYGSPIIGFTMRMN